MKTIKTFVRRKGRFSPRLQSALTNDLPQFQLLLDDHPWSFEQIFHRQAPTIVEIGFGMGHSLLEMAIAHPENNYIGIEIHEAGLATLAARLQAAALTNVRIVSHDAIEIFEKMIPAKTLAGIQIFFPDPWPKKRHHKRRLIQSDTLLLLVQALQSNGWIHMATDWKDYAEHSLAVFTACPLLRNAVETGGFTARPAHRPLTKFESRGLQLGHEIFDLMFIA